MKDLHIVFNIDYKEKNGQVSFFRESIVKQIRDQMLEIPNFGQFKILLSRLEECRCFFWVHPSLGSKLVSKGFESQIMLNTVPELDLLEIEYKKITRTSNISKSENIFHVSNMTSLMKEMKSYKTSELRELLKEKEEILLSSMSDTNFKKILVIAATPLESKVFFKTFEKEIKAKPISKERVTFWDFGNIGNCNLLMVKTSEMGSSKPSGSGLVIKDCIDLIDPDYIIMVGIAFGLKEDSQKIGNILVSRELENYESSKILDNKESKRGHRIPAGVVLLDRFDNSSIKYDKVDVNLGYMLSGDKLVDSKKFIEKLKKEYPEAIGGEMEGTGLQSTCHREKKEWIVVKGISDWGYNKQHPNKDKDQELAIKNVCDFLIYTLTNFEF